MISECKSRLKADIVEALQYLKCAIRQDLLFKEPGPLSITEALLDCDNESGEEEGGDDHVWENLLVDGDEDDNALWLVTSMNFSDFFTAPRDLSEKITEMSAHSFQ